MPLLQITSASLKPWIVSSTVLFPTSTNCMHKLQPMCCFLQVCSSYQDECSHNNNNHQILHHPLHTVTYLLSWMLDSASNRKQQALSCGWDQNWSREGPERAMPRTRLLMCASLPWPAHLHDTTYIKSYWSLVISYSGNGMLPGENPSACVRRTCRIDVA